jgi:pancreatic triacylglycerol lipase
VAAAPSKLPHNYELVPDADYNMHLVDLSTYEADAEGRFDPIQDMVYILFTRSTQASGQVIQLNDAASLAASAFNPNNPTRITIHGWNGGPGARVNTATRAQWFINGDYNAITVDWSVGAGTLNYVTARNRVRDTGAAIAQFINFLVDVGGMNMNDLNCLGHSLGGQVCGLTGKEVFPRRMNTIIGLDQAGPLFFLDRPAERLDATDAEYVESIITNAGNLGFAEHVSHATFYPNGGVNQPGCGTDISGNCAHQRPHEFYAESITSSIGFWGQQCANWEEIVNNNQCTVSGPSKPMGGDPVVRGNGVYWLETHDESPFAMGQ